MLLLKAPATLHPQELNVFYQAIDQWTETAIWILFSIAVIAALTLARKLKPIMNEIERCGRLKTTEIRTLELNTFLSRVEEKYLELASKVDSINAEYFCSSEVCSLRIKVLFINVSAAKIQDFVAQSPSLQKRMKVELSTCQLQIVVGREPRLWCRSQCRAFPDSPYIVRMCL